MNGFENTQTPPKETLTNTEETPANVTALRCPAELPSALPYEIDYDQIVETVQLSIARQLGIAGALKAKSFQECMAPYSAEDQQQIICDVGSRFDDELITLLTALAAFKRQPIVITAGKDAGIDGYLFWEDKLAKHIQDRKDTGALDDLAEIRVIRPTEEIAQLTRKARALAA